MTYQDFKDLARRTFSDRALRDRSFNITKKLKNDEYQRGLASMIYKCFDKKSASLTDKSAKAGDVNNEVKQNEQIAEQLQKPIIKKWEKQWYAINKQG